MKIDTLIKNGHIIDPSRGLDKVGNIATRSGKIFDLTNVAEVEADAVVDAEGCIVVPGLIDYHAHANYHASDVGIPLDIAMIPKGVTSFVDCGSVGVSNCRAYLEYLNRCVVKSKLYLHISPLGLSTREFVERIFPDKWNMDKLEAVFDEFSDKILGFKMRLNRSVMEQCGMDGFYRMLEIAEQLHKPVLVHPSDPLTNQAEILNALRPGDVYCHCYQGKGSTIIEDGHVIPEVWGARKRGVIFDVAHGGGNFDFQVAEAAFAEGFLPDMISSDLSMLTFNKQPLCSLTHTMSKMLYLGMPLTKIIRCVTEAPAKNMGMEKKIGTLAPGSSGDVTVLKLIDMPVTLWDTHKHSRQAQQILKPIATVANGMLVYMDAVHLAQQNPS